MLNNKIPNKLAKCKPNFKNVFKIKNNIKKPKNTIYKYEFTREIQF
jgi:hypothetical protein